MNVGRPKQKWTDEERQLVRKIALKHAGLAEATRQAKKHMPYRSISSIATEIMKGRA